MRALVFYSGKRSIPGFIKYLEEELYLLGIQSVFIKVQLGTTPILDFEINSAEDFAISLGGDGTVLHVAQLLYGLNPIPLFPVNFGSLGFITEIRKNELIPLIKKFLSDEVCFEERLMLEIEVFSGKKKVYTGLVLNEAVLTRHQRFQLLELELRINNFYVCRYRSDGLIIATPTGSTAYSLSAGGPILEPEIKQFLINPICAHSLGSRPLVVSAEKIVEIRVLHQIEQKLVLDGQERTHLRAGDIVIIKAAKQFIKIVQPDQRNFFSVLREKLNWLD